MNFWITLWTLVFFLGVGIFAVLAVVVTVGGLSDIRVLFKALDRHHTPQHPQPPEP